VWQIKLSKHAKNFIEQERIEDDRILGLMKRFVNYLYGHTEKTGNICEQYHETT